MKKILSIAIALAIGLPLLAQEEASKHENVTWHEVNFITYKADKVWDAKALIKDFEAASEKSGTQFPEEYWFETGKADVMLVWELKGGPGELEWAWAPESIKWWKALIEIKGSEEAARKHMMDYNACIASSSKQLVRRTVR